MDKFGGEGFNDKKAMDLKCAWDYQEEGSISKDLQFFLGGGGGE